MTAETVGATGVEMEALTAVKVGLLKIYDKCKAADRGMVIEGVRLLENRSPWGQRGCRRSLSHKEMLRRKSRSRPRHRQKMRCAS